MTAREARRSVPHASARSEPPRLPLGLRLPNPPAVFVGREREIDALVTAIERAPVACVWGVGGLGKSALTLHVLHARFAADVPRTLAVRIARDGDVDQALLAVARTLADLRGEAGIDWRALLTERDALVAAAIDLVEGAGSGPRASADEPFRVVMDDLHHADGERAAHVLALIARYARGGRWIAISRTNLLPNELGQTVALGAMPSADLSRLVAGWGVGALDDRVLAAAAGSPWRLQQLLAGAEPGLEPGTGDPFDGLSQDEIRFLLDLALADGEVPEAALARFTEVPPPSRVDALERRGLVERRASGLRVHDVARVLLEPRRSGEERAHKRREAARALAQSPEPRTVLEGLRILVEDGRSAEIARVLDDRGAALLSPAHVLDLWRLLGRSAAPELTSWRLRCATEIGDPVALRAIPLPASPTVADRSLWALSLFQQARYDEAAAAANVAVSAALAAGDAAVTFDARRVLGRSALNLGDVDRALAAFEAQAPVTAREAALVGADIAACLVMAERRDEALARIEPVEAALTADPALGDAPLQYGVGWVLYQLGELARAQRLAERCSSSPRHAILRIAIACDRGDLPGAADLLERFHALGSRSRTHDAFSTVQDLLVRLGAGRLDGLRAAADRLVEKSDALARPDVSSVSRALRHRIAIAIAEPPRDEPDAPAPDDVQGALLGLWQAIHRARWGLRPPASVIDSNHGPAATIDRDHTRREPRAAHFSRSISDQPQGGPTSTAPRTVPISAPPLLRRRHLDSPVPEVRVTAALAQAELALAAGDIPSAVALAEAAVELAAHTGYGAIEAIAREAHLTAAVLSNAPEADVLAAARALRALAAPCAMTPLVSHADLLALLASRATLDPARLEAFAIPGDAAAPARRARALLGEEAALDHLDRALVDAAHRRTGARVVTVRAAASGAEAARTFGLDDRTSTVWLPDRTCSLAARPLLWRILLVLAEAGGAADKEALVRGAWRQRDYHPLRDDARLHTAIRTLRRMIEDDPVNPACVVTTDDGYAFGRTLAVRRLLLRGDAPADLYADRP